MPSYIVRKRATSKDGSTLGGGQIVVTASSELEAKKAGAEELGTTAQHVEAVPYGNPHWSELRGN